MEHPMLDMKEKPCPIPVIEVKKIFSQCKEGDIVSVLVDNDIARQNLQKMAQGMGMNFSWEENSDHTFSIRIEYKSQTKNNTPEPVSRSVIAISSATMGKGDDELGAMLMKSFIYSLRELETPPATLLFFNGGVKITTEGSACLDDLKTLQEKGVLIQSCGACLNFYQLSEKLEVGEVTNMLVIAQTMTNATNLVNL